MRNEKSEVSRAAILIGCPSRGTNSLPGVYRDLENMRTFLRSPRSGCFQDNEIYTLEHATFDTVQSTLMEVKVDYCMIYFSGHGFTNGQTKQRMLCLEDHKVPDTLFKTESKTELVLVDACRNHIPTISGLPEYVEPYDSFVGSLARVAFDDWIRSALKGRLVVYGTKDNTPSVDSLNGGVFTHSLLNVACNIRITGAEFSRIYLSQLLPHVERDIKIRSRETQIPDIVSQTEGYDMPFIINAQQISVAKNTPKETGDTEKKEFSPLAKLLTTSLVLWGLYSLVKG